MHRIKRASITRPTIGFLAIANFRSSLAQELVAGVNSAAKEYDVNIINFCNGYKYSLGDTFTYARYYKRIFPYLTKKNIDGLISWASSMAYIMPFDEVEKLHASITSIPLVCLGMQMENIPSLVIENEGGIRSLMKHLIEVHGFSKIAFIGDKKGYHHNYCNEERYDAYRTVLAESGIAFRDDFVFVLDDLDHKAINKAVNALFEKRKLRPRKDIEAIVTISDIVSNRLVEILAARNIRVPEDIAVVGFNNTFEGIRADPPLTTVDPLYYRYGHTAIQMILDQIEKKKVPFMIRMPVELLVRQSCGCYEDSIATVMEGRRQKAVLAAKTAKPQKTTARETVLAGLGRIIHKYDPDFNPRYIEDLYDSLMNDIESRTSRKFITALKKYFFGNKYPIEKILTLENVISEMRKQILPELSAKRDLARMAEDIFHQARVMINISTNYITMVRMHYTYQLGRMAFIAADYNAVNNFREFGDMFRTHLMDFDIPGAFVVVTGEEAGMHGGGKIVSSHYRKGNQARDTGTMDVLPGCILPKSCYPGERFSMMFQLYSYRDEHLGYLVFVMGPFDIPLYDSMRMITSPSIWRLLRSNALQTEKTPSRLITNDRTKSRGEKSGISGTDGDHDGRRPRLVSRNIMECLNRFIDEPTDVSRFAAELGVSVATLVRKTKSLTGSSVQKLHEKIKMEKAMLLLENREYSVAEIAEKLGYGNQFYFSSVFKRYSGMPPLKWMKIRNP